MPNDAAAPTQGGFLDLFADKIALARALLQRYLGTHARILDPLFARAGVLTDDPMQRMLIGLKLFAEPLENMPDGHLGCMAAAVCWQERLLDAEVRERSMSGLLNWRARFLAMFTGIAAGYATPDQSDLSALADVTMGVVAGGNLLAKAMQDLKALTEQVVLFRGYVELLFSPEPPARAEPSPSETVNRQDASAPV